MVFVLVCFNRVNVVTVTVHIDNPIKLCVGLLTGQMRRSIYTYSPVECLDYNKGSIASGSGKKLFFDQELYFSYHFYFFRQNFFMSVLFV
jgi:hypothetical protein